VSRSSVESPYRRAFEQSLRDPDTFWGNAAQAVTWAHPPTAALDASAAPFYRWFADGELNMCVNAVDRHVAAGRGEQRALVYDSPVTGRLRTYTFRELLHEVVRCAGALQRLGVRRGDRVVIYMPMVPEAVIGMLACARIGAVHSVVFGGFAAAELAARIDDARPAVILAASCGIEPSRVIAYKPILDAALSLADHKPHRCVVLQRPEQPCTLNDADISWEDALQDAPEAEPVTVQATDPLYVLYTSGTTGRPKGIVRDTGGYAVALTWSMSNIFDTRPGDVYWAASDVGWVVGHSYIVYGPLLHGCTTVLYEGKPVGTPDSGAFWRVIADHGVNVLFTAPTAIRAIRKEDPDARELTRHDVASLRGLFLAGERLDPATYEWAQAQLGIPIVDNWWQTETGWPIAANLRGLESMATKPGSPTVAVPGFDVRVLDRQGVEVAPGQEGAICIKLPLPPGALSSLWQDDERYVQSYLSAFDGYYLSGDGGYVDDDGYLFVMGRTDDVINVAGHRLSTGQLEEVIAAHPAVAECAVIGVQDALKGQLPRGFVVLKAGATIEPTELTAALVALVREQVGPVAALKRIDVVPALPKTRSGKILRKTMRRIAEGHEDPVPATIEDPAVLESLRATLRPSPRTPG
jgi:propionyl-CoA synthetase